jgi:hypothetical protein
VQTLYLPALALGGTAAVADRRDAVFDLPFVENSPEPEVPAVLPEQPAIPHGQQPRSLVRVKVEFHQKKVVLWGHAVPPLAGHAHILRADHPKVPARKAAGFRSQKNCLWPDACRLAVVGLPEDPL